MGTSDLVLEQEKQKAKQASQEHYRTLTENSFDSKESMSTRELIQEHLLLPDSAGQSPPERSAAEICLARIIVEWAPCEAPNGRHRRQAAPERASRVLLAGWAFNQLLEERLKPALKTCGTWRAYAKAEGVPWLEHAASVLFQEYAIADDYEVDRDKKYLYDRANRLRKDRHDRDLERCRKLNEKAERANGALEKMNGKPNPVANLVEACVELLREYARRQLNIKRKARPISRNSKKQLIRKGPKDRANSPYVARHAAPGDTTAQGLEQLISPDPPPDRAVELKEARLLQSDLTPLASRNAIDRIIFLVLTEAASNMDNRRLIKEWCEDAEITARDFRQLRGIPAGRHRGALAKQFGLTEAAVRKRWSRLGPVLRQIKNIVMRRLNPLLKGDRVEVQDGRWRGSHGVILDASTPDRVVVQVKVLGSEVTFEVDEAALKAID